MTEPRPTNDDLDELASAYLDGEATPTERAQVEADPAAMETVARYRDQAQRFAAPLPEPSAAIQTAAISAALDVFIARTPINLSDQPEPLSAPDPTQHETAPAQPDTASAQPDTASDPEGGGDYAVGAASITGLTEAVDVPDEADEATTSISTTPAPNDTSHPHRPMATGGDAGRGRRRWLQKISPATVAIAALVAIIGGVGIFNLTQSDDSRVTSTASPGSAYAEDALDAGAASAEVLSEGERGESDMNADAMSDSEQSTAKRSESETAEMADMTDEAMSDDAMADSAMSDDAMADDAMSDETMADDVMAEESTLEDSSARESETEGRAPSARPSDSFGTDGDEDVQDGFAPQDQDGASADFAEDGDDATSTGSSPSSGSGASDDAEFTFAESDSIAPFESGSANSDGSGSDRDGSDTGGNDGTTGGNSGSSGGGDSGSSGGGSTGGGSSGGTDTDPVALNLRTDYLGTFSTISQLMSEATDRSPTPDRRDLPKSVCDKVQDDLDKYSPTKLIGTGRIGGKDYVVYLISRTDRYDTAAATALDTCLLEIGQPYSS